MSQTVTIIDYGSGNLRSAEKAFYRAIQEAELDMNVHISGDAEDIRKADRIVLPGQGAFGDCMRGLSAVSGMIDVLHEKVIKAGTPFFGICVGMQLLATRGTEHGVHEGLGWIDGDVIKIKPSDSQLKIPHMGWNDVAFTSAGLQHSALQCITNKSASYGPDFYFVHSFVFDCKKASCVLATAEYGGSVTALVGRDNILGMNFTRKKAKKPDWI